MESHDTNENQNTKSVYYKPLPVIERLEDVLAAKERKIKQCTIRLNELRNKQHQLVIKEAYLRRTQNSMHM